MKKWLLYSIFAGYLILGCTISIFLKTQNKYVILGKAFNHPVFQTASMFLGEVGCLCVHIFSTYIFDKDNVDPSDAPLKDRILFVIPALFDTLNVAFSLTGLTMTAAGVYQMMLGGVSLWTFFLSICYLKTQYKQRHYLGLVLLITGLGLVGIASIIWSKNDANGTPTMPLGVILIAIGQFFAAFQAIAEEKLFGMYNCQPMEAIGIEGCTGFIICSALLVIFQNIPCSTIYDVKGNVQFCPFGVFEDTLLAFKQMSADSSLLALVIGYSTLVIYVAYAQTVIIKYGSSMIRSLMICLRSLCVWVTSLLLGWEHFIWGQLLGFVVMVVGIMIFKEVIVIRHFGCDEGIEISESEKNDTDPNTELIEVNNPENRRKSSAW